MGTDGLTEAYALMKSLVVLVLLAVTQTPVAHTQTLLSRDEQNVANFAFATQLGSGVYSVSGRTLQIYRLPFSHTLKSTDDSDFGVELTLPVTFGFYDFELQDINDGDIPTSVDALSFVPGLTLVFEVQPGWALEPYAEAGIARARDTGADSYVYSGGLRSLYAFDGQGFDWLLRNDLTYAGVDVRGAEGSNRFARFQTVVTAQRPFAHGSSVDYLVYALNEYYVDQPSGPLDSAVSGGSAVQYEIGVTLGTASHVASGACPCHGWHRLSIRVGLDVFRSSIGTPF